MVTGSYAKFKKTHTFVEAIVFMVAKGSQDIIQQALANGVKQAGETGTVSQVDLRLMQRGPKTPRAKGRHLNCCLNILNI